MVTKRVIQKSTSPIALLTTCIIVFGCDTNLLLASKDCQQIEREVRKMLKAEHVQAKISNLNTIMISVDSPELMKLEKENLEALAKKIAPLAYDTYRYRDDLEGIVVAFLASKKESLWDLMGNTLLVQFETTETGVEFVSTYSRPALPKN